ncbi:MAG: hypothetical protein IJF74_01420 [Clostridia bacterium]|nr:hypothetical protein [Clostridia bacterium]
MRKRVLNAIKLNTARLLALVMLLSSLCPVMAELAPCLRAADATIDTGGVILITESGNYVIDGTDKEIYSITVFGDIDVKLYLYNVEIDGRDWTYSGYTGENSTTSYWLNGAKTECNNAFRALYEAGMELAKIDSGWRYGNKRYYVPTCPLLVTNGATATVEMNGDNVFRAGVNKVTVNSSYVITNAGINGSTLESCGYAGIQVDPGCTLTIKGTANSSCEAYGGWQFDDRRPHRNDGESTPWANPTISVNGTTYNMKSEDSGARTSGAPGIGGGAGYRSDSFGGRESNLTYGSSGNLIINGLDCDITAKGGHQAAGIGGACNSPAAAVGHSITINSGNITVNGGRWAAGIGDGDTVNTWVSPDFYTENTALPDEEKYFINVNGGNLTVTGGIGAAGIGSSDRISVGEGGGTDAYSRLAINILGGNVTVRSGFPDAGVNGSYANKSTSLSAAIGAGSDSNMLPNSITVGGDVHLDAASFSAYAINNYGTEANKDTVPVVNLDSASHLFLCNFSTYPSSVDRVISLYPAEFAMVYEYDSAEDVYNELEKCEIYNYNDGGEQKKLVQITSTLSGTPVTGFTYIETDTVNEQEIYFLSDPSSVYAYEVTIGGKVYYCKTENETVAANGILADHLSYSKDTSEGAIDTYSVPDYFKAIAVTLPTYDPSDDKTGGHYVVDIPLTGVDENVLPDGMNPASSISAGVTSIEQGVISGKITYPVEHNIKLDPVTGDLETIKVFAGGTASGTDYLGLAAGETPLYSYDVYLPAKTDGNPTTQATLQLMYSGDFTVEYTQPVDRIMSYSGETYTVSGLSAGSPVTVRARVQETVDGVKLSAVTYVITIYVRKTYTMQITAPISKVYDGSPYAVSANDIVVRDSSYNEVPVTQDIFDQIAFEYSQADPKDVGNYSVNASVSPKNEPWEASCSHSFSITQRALVITGVEKWMQYLDDNKADTYKGPFEIGDIYFTGAVSGDNVSITVANGGTAYSVYDIGEQNERNGENYLRLEDPTPSSSNYTVQYTADNYVDVMCRIYYDMKGAIFRTDVIGNEWDKFFPVDSDAPLNFDDINVQNNYQHAQGSNTHTESVFFHSVNLGEEQAMYCVDIEFGSLDFTFTKRVWNVSILDYDDTQGVWVGFDGVQNRITVRNYSNKPVYIDMLATVDPGEAQQLLGQKGLGIKLDSVNGDVKSYENAFVASNPSSLFPSEDTAEFTVAAATQRIGSTAGSPGANSYYVFMLNSPKFGENAGKQTTATVNVTVSQTP